MLNQNLPVWHLAESAPAAYKATLFVRHLETTRRKGIKKRNRQHKASPDIRFLSSHHIYGGEMSHSV